MNTQAHGTTVGGTRRRRILVVDDYRDGADALADVLRLEGAEVRVAYDGSTAVAVAQDFVPDIVLLDLSLGEMDGCRVAEQLRQSHGGTRLLALTGWDRPGDRQRASEAGFEDYFLKGVDFDRLLSALQ